MAIRRKQSATYVADTGKEFETSEMSDSHLLNVITHHMKQIETLQFVEKYVIPPHHLNARVKLLQETVQLLTEELATRDPVTEDERRGASISAGKSKWEY